MLRQLAQRLRRPTAGIQHVQAAIETPLAGLCGQPAARSFTAFRPAQELHVACGHPTAACPTTGAQPAAAAAINTPRARGSFAVKRMTTKAPEFTAAGGSPPTFTGGNDRAAGAGAGGAGSAAAGVPDFAAGSGSGPAFTAGPDAGAAGAADLQAHSADDGGAGGWDGSVGEALEQVQEAALAHVVRLDSALHRSHKAFCRQRA